MTAARLAVLSTAVLLASLPGPATANPGDFDPAFNGGAPVLLDLAPTASTGTGLMAAQVDGAGRIVVAGFTSDENLGAAALARLLPDGSLDPSFGDAGKTVTQAGRGGGTVFSMLASLVARPGVGGWIATGGASASDGRQAVLALATDEDGHLDLNFGSGGTTRLQAAGAPPAFTLAFGGGGHGGVAADGSIFVGHAIALDPMMSSNTRVVVVKLTSGGDPADDFGSMGVYTNGFSQTGSANTNYGWGALPTPDGILLTGSTLDAAGRSALLLVRLTAVGALDGTFASGAGYRVVQASDPAAPVAFSQGTALALGPGGLIYVAGTANDADGHSALAVARFAGTGTLDATYGDAGIARVQTANADPGETPGSFTGGVALQADGSALVIGASGSGNYAEIVVVRFTPGGDVDPTFGIGGVVRLQPATVSEPETFGFGGTIAPDGNTLVVVGQMRQAVGGRGVVARIQLTTPTTTTTTLPDPCAPADSLADALCRLRGLGGLVDGMTPAGTLRDRLVGAATKGEARLQESSTLVGRPRKKKLKKVLRLVARFETIVTSRRGRKVYTADQIASLTAAASEIARIVTALRASS